MKKSNYPYKAGAMIKEKTACGWITSSFRHAASIQIILTGGDDGKRLRPKVTKSVAVNCYRSSCDVSARSKKP
jgi:hypothetical protein